MFTVTGTIGLAIITTGAEMAGFPMAQDVFEVSWQVTASPLDGV